SAEFETETPLTLIRSASGSGKTTALVDWAATTSAHVVWLTVTPAITRSEALAGALLRVLPGADRRDDGDEGWAAVAARLHEA
ncbi:hypothetical protein, partial [Microbacterium sp. H6]